MKIRFGVPLDKSEGSVKGTHYFVHLPRPQLVGVFGWGSVAGRDGAGLGA
jgi:hypothetical protein